MYLIYIRRAFKNRIEKESEKDTWATLKMLDHKYLLTIPSNIYEVCISKTNKIINKLLSMHKLS